MSWRVLPRKMRLSLRRYSERACDRGGAGWVGITLVWYGMKIRLSAPCSVEFQDVSEMLQISSNIYRVDCFFFIIDVREQFVEFDMNNSILKSSSVTKNQRSKMLTKITMNCTFLVDEIELKGQNAKCWAWSCANVCNYCTS